MSRRGVGPGRGEGFALIELAASLALAGIVAAAAIAVLSSQREFYAASSDRVHARQSTRAAADLIYSDLRTAGPADLMAATRDSVSVRFDLVRSVVCGPAAAPPPGRVALFVFDSVPNANLPARFRGSSFSDPYSGAWRHADGARLDAAAGTGRRACEERGAPAGGPSWRYRTVPVSTLSSLFDSVPGRGAVVTRYGRLTFSLEPSGWSVPGVAIYRNSQELVAPFRDETAFSYRMSDGSVRPAVAAVDLGGVRAVRLAAVPLGLQGARGAGGELRLEVPLQR